jgi:hypothetical protein
VTNPLSVASYSISGLGGSCSTRADPNSIGDYACTVTGSPNQSGSILFKGYNAAPQTACVTWQIISSVVQVFVQNSAGYVSCTKNGIGGFESPQGLWQIQFTLGLTSSASSGNVEFIWD